MKNIRNGILLGLLLSLFAATSVLAQAESLTLSLSRDWGYGGFGGDIQGTFSMKAGGPASLARVEFYIDETKIGEVNKAPFNLQFVTDNYPLGAHSLYAVGFTSDGQRLESKKTSATFVSASEGATAALQIIVPVLALVFGAMLLAAIVPIITGRRNKNLPPGAPRQYTLGGAICPKCSRPFGMHLYGFNLLTHKLDRCPYCGHWGLVGRASPDQLRAAEQAEMANAADQVQATSEEEKLRKELDDSKYQNL